MPQKRRASSSPKRIAPNGRFKRKHNKARQRKSRARTAQQSKVSSHKRDVGPGAPPGMVSRHSNRLQRLERVKGLSERLVQSGVVDSRMQAQLELEIWATMNADTQGRMAQRSVAALRDELSKPVRSPLRRRADRGRMVMSKDGLIPEEAAEAAQLIRTAQLLDRATRAAATRSVHLSRATTAAGRPYTVHATTAAAGSTPCTPMHGAQIHTAGRDVGERSVPRAYPEGLGRGPPQEQSTVGLPPHGAVHSDLSQRSLMLASAQRRSDIGALHDADVKLRRELRRARPATHSEAEAWRVLGPLPIGPRLRKRRQKLNSASSSAAYNFDYTGGEHDAFYRRTGASGPVPGGDAGSGQGSAPLSAPEGPPDSQGSIRSPIPSQDVLGPAASIPSLFGLESVSGSVLLGLDEGDTGGERSLVRGTRLLARAAALAQAEADSGLNVRPQSQPDVYRESSSLDRPSTATMVDSLGIRNPRIRRLASRKEGLPSRSQILQELSSSKSGTAPSSEAVSLRLSGLPVGGRVPPMSPIRKPQRPGGVKQQTRRGEKSGKGRRSKHANRQSSHRKQNNKAPATVAAGSRARRQPGKHPASSRQRASTHTQSPVRASALDEPTPMSTGDWKAAVSLLEESPESRSRVASSSSGRDSPQAGMVATLNKLEGLDADGTVATGNSRRLPAVPRLQLRQGGGGRGSGTAGTAAVPQEDRRKSRDLVPSKNSGGKQRKSSKSKRRPPSHVDDTKQVATDMAGHAHRQVDHGSGEHGAALLVQLRAPSLTTTNSVRSQPGSSLQHDSLPPGVEASQSKPDPQDDAAKASSMTKVLDCRVEDGNTSTTDQPDGATEEKQDRAARKQAEKEKEAARKQAEKEKEAARKQAEKEKAARKQAEKEKEAARKQAEKEKEEAARKQAEKEEDKDEAARKQAEKEKEEKEEAARKQAEKEKEAARKQAEKEKEAARKQAEKEKEAARKQAEKEKEAARKQAEEDKDEAARKQAEKEKEAARKQAEKEKEEEEEAARKQAEKEKEAARKQAEKEEEEAQKQAEKEEAGHSTQEQRSPSVAAARVALDDSSSPDGSKSAKISRPESKKHGDHKGEPRLRDSAEDRELRKQKKRKQVTEATRPSEERPKSKKSKRSKQSKEGTDASEEHKSSKKHKKSKKSKKKGR